MLKISNIVEEIVVGSEVISSALSDGLLNLSAYAEKIQSEVESRTKKPVKKGSIVAALARMQKRSSVNHNLAVDVKIENLTVKSPLWELVYDRTPEILGKLKNFYANNKIEASEYFTVTQGINEISIIAGEKAKILVEKIFEVKPKVYESGLVALAVRFSDEYISQPNVIFSLLRRIAIKKVVIAELVSTYTELTFIIKHEDMEKVLSSFEPGR